METQSLLLEPGFLRSWPSDQLLAPDTHVLEVRIRILVAPLFGEWFEHKQTLDCRYLDLREYPDDLEGKCRLALEYVDKEIEKEEDIDRIGPWIDLENLLEERRWDEFEKQAELGPMREELEKFIQEILHNLMYTGNATKEAAPCQEVLENGEVLTLSQPEIRFQIAQLSLEILFKSKTTKETWEEQHIWTIE